MVTIGILIAAATLAANWWLQAELTSSALKSRAVFVASALSTNAERYTSAHELMTHMQSLGASTIGLKEIALVDSRTGEIVAATEEAWLSLPVSRIPQFNNSDGQSEWAGHVQDEFGFALQVRLETGSIERLSGQDYIAMMVFDGSGLVAYINKIILTFTAIAGLGGVGLWTAFTWLLKRRVLDPVNLIHRALERRTDLDKPLVLPPMYPDEIGQLGSYLSSTLAEIGKVSEDLMFKTQAIEGSSSEVYVIDATKLTIMSANKTACKNLRCSMDDIVGAPISKYAPDIADPVLIGRLTSDLIEKGEANHTYLHHRTDGTTYPFEFKSLFIHGKAKTVLVVLGNDVSERHAQEDAMRRSEKRTQLALKGSNDGVFDLDVASSMLFVSDLIRDWLGFDGNQIYLDDFYACVAPNDVARVEAAFVETLDNGADLNMEFQLRIQSVSGRWLQARGQLQEGMAGAKHLSGFFSEVTSRKVAETMLYASVSRLGAVLDHIADGILTLNDTGEVCTINPAALEMFALSKSEFAGSNLGGWLELASAEDSFEVVNWAKVCDGQIRETRAKRSDGRYFASEISVTRMEGVGEERYTVVVRNIAERKEHELALRTTMEDAQAATRAKGDFLATMSHEIRTPMNGVLGMTQLLLDMDLTDLQKETAETIFSSGESLLALINDILDFSKIEAGKLEFEKIPFDLRAAVKDVMDLISTTARRKSLDLYIDYPADLDFAFIGDVGRIRQILLNLASNAIKFTTNGHVLVKIAKIESDGEVSLMRVGVEDTGLGIEPDVQQGLFEVFTQADASTTRKFGGTGLGLAICKQLVTLMGGEIGLNSKPGRGSEFWFTLPMTGSDPSQLLQIQGEDRLQGKRMLVVDDNDVGVRIGCEMGRSFGMETEGCMQPGSVADLLDRSVETNTPFDVIALDYNMPGLDGLTLATNIRGDDRFDAVKIVMLTSSDIKEPQGLDGYTLKPLMRDGLRRLLVRALYGEQANDQSVSDENKIRSVASGMRVLVAEDNPVNQRVATRMLEKLGCRVDVAGNGREAVEMWQQFGYAMIFMDCQMPELDGLSATREIRLQEQSLDRAPTPIVAMTANAMTQDQQDCLAAGMDDYASKPVKLDLLQSLVVKWSTLDSRGVQEPLH